MTLAFGTQVLVALRRPPGYEDVHPELVAEDAMHPDWPWYVVGDDEAAVIIRIDRPEGYERESPAAVAREAVKRSWPTWSVLNGPRWAQAAAASGGR